MNTSYDEMLKYLGNLPNVANHEIFILTKDTYEKCKNCTEPSINGNEMYLNYVNAVDVITKLYNKFLV